MEVTFDSDLKRKGVSPPVFYTEFAFLHRIARAVLLKVIAIRLARQARKDFFVQPENLRDHFKFIGRGSKCPGQTLEWRPDPHNWRPKR